MTRFHDLAGCLAVAVELCSAWALQAQTNETHRHELLARPPVNNASAYSRRAAFSRYVPTNTLAFRDYALGVCLTQANFVNRSWNLGLPDPITSDQVTFFSAQPKIGGIEGGIMLSNRFSFGFRDGAWAGMLDLKAPGEDEELTKLKSLLTPEDARRLAEEALLSVGLDETQLKLPRPPIVTQREMECKDGRRRRLPMFEVVWKKPGWESGPMSMEISGITKKILSYHHWSAKPMPLPTNYFAMLGISPHRNEWGKQFGYDPLDTDEFRAWAQTVAAAEGNRLIRIFDLGAPGCFTNEITMFSATPRTNNFDIPMVQFGERFYMQFHGSQLQWFRDKANDIDAMDESDESKKLYSRMRNLLDARGAERLAREALHRLGLDEKQLQLVEPPRIKQWEAELSEQEGGRKYKLPLYDVRWLFPEKERQFYGEEAAAVAFQISGVTRKVTMYSTLSPLMPRLPLPTNYLSILGVAPDTTKAGSGASH